MPGSRAIEITLPTEAEEAAVQAQVEQLSGPKPTVLPRPDGRISTEEFIDRLNESFAKIQDWAGVTIDRMDAQTAEIEQLKERIQDLEAAALGKPLEEIT